MANENEPDPEQIRKQMEETRTALTEKLEALESQVADTVKSATDVVSEATENVKETVETVTEGVKETVETVSETFNLRRQMEKRPWLIFGGSVALGCALGSMLGGRSYRYRYYYTGRPTPPVPPPLPQPAGSAGLAPSRLSAEPQRAPEPPRHRGPSTFSWLGEQLGSLKGLAVSTLMGAVRDLVVRNLPESLSHRVAEEVDQMTRRMGGEPIRGSVLPEQHGGQEEGRREGNGKGGQEGMRSAHQSGQESHGSPGVRY